MKILLLLVLSLTAGAEDAKQKAMLCASCHGQAGVSANSLWPNLAGQKVDYLIKQLHAFHDGVRIDPLMSPVSQTLNDDDIKLLAKYYSEMKPAP